MGTGGDNYGGMSVDIDIPYINQITGDLVTATGRFPAAFDTTNDKSTGSSFMTLLLQITSANNWYRRMLPLEEHGFPEIITGQGTIELANEFAVSFIASDPSKLLP